MLQVLTLNILTTVKSYDELLRKVKIDHYVCKIGLLKIIKHLKRYIRREDAVCAPWERCDRRERAVYALWTRCSNCLRAVKKSWTL